MKKPVNIAIIGMGKWGNHLLENVIKIKSLIFMIIFTVSVMDTWR